MLCTFGLMIEKEEKKKQEPERGIPTTKEVREECVHERKRKGRVVWPQDANLARLGFDSAIPGWVPGRGMVSAAGPLHSTLQTADCSRVPVPLPVNQNRRGSPSPEPCWAAGASHLPQRNGGVEVEGCIAARYRSALRYCREVLRPKTVAC